MRSVRSIATTCSLGAVAGIAVLTACAAPNSDPAPTTTAPPTTTSAAPTGTEPGPGGFTEAQTADLCARMDGQLQSWRTYTPSVGRGGFNILVGEWGAANGVDLVALAGDRGRVDAATEAQCPDTRSGAIDALEIPDLAAGLVGF